MRWFSGWVLVLAACSGSQNDVVDGNGPEEGIGDEPTPGSGGSTAGSTAPAAAGDSTSGGTSGHATGGGAGVASSGRGGGSGASNTGGSAGAAQVDAAVDSARAPVAACPPGVSTAPIGEW